MREPRKPEPPMTKWASPEADDVDMVCLLVLTREVEKVVVTIKMVLVVS